MAGQVNGDRRAAERGDHQVPGVRILPAAVQEHQLRLGRAPDQDAQLLMPLDLD